MDERAFQDVIDRQVITETIYRYASSIDQKDYATLRTVFTDDALAQFATAPELRGGDTIVAWIDEMGQTQAFQHHMINVYHVDLDGDEATTLTYHTSHQIRQDEPDVVYQIVGRYRQRLRRVDGKWQIADLRLEVGWMEERTFSQSVMSDREAEENLAAQARVDQGD